VPVRERVIAILDSYASLLVLLLANFFLLVTRWLRQSEG
jgi:hypothetical protein